VSIYPHFTLAATPADQLEKAMMEGYMIAEGRRVEESEYVMRVVGIMRIYFLLLNGEECVSECRASFQERMWQTLRYRAFFASMLTWDEGVRVCCGT